MAWTTPITFITDEILTASDLNASLRDNMNETAVAKATTPGSYFVYDENALTERQPLMDYVGGSVEITSTSFVTGGGPELTVEHGESMFVMWSARGFVTSGVAGCVPALDGAGASNNDALRFSGLQADIFRGSCYKLYEDLTPGTTTVDLRYITSAGTANFGQRRLLVWPL